MSNRKEFKNRLNRYRKEVANDKKAFDQIANIRLFVFLIAIFITVLTFVKSNLLYGYISLFTFSTILLLIIIKHYKIKKKYIRAQCLVDINKNYLDRLEDDWVNFKDCGEDFVDSSHSYTSDLDIFGAKSLFQWISVANTFYGRENLKQLLEKPDKDKESIRRRQEAVAEISKKVDFCQELQYEGILSKESNKDPEYLLAYAEDPTKLLKHNWIKSLFYISPFLLILSLTLYFTGSPIPLYLPVLIMVIHTIVGLIGYSRTSSILNRVYGINNSLTVFKNLLLLIEKEKVESSYLLQLKRDITYNEKPASECIEILEKISNSINLRYNAIVYFLLNVFFLWDYHCIFNLENWKEEYGMVLRNVFHTIGKYEAISSLSVVQQLYPEWTFPQFPEKNKLSFLAMEMGHPLIKKNCVCNDITIDNNSSVITGSNMSGKTTLLRTIGVNLVLAYAGAPVFAKSLETSIVDIFTSMRVGDDLSSGISTFYAELLRIKMIIDYSHNKQPMIYLIDEMFRGTNSKDRIIGAQSVLKNLNKEWVIGLISTHDFELCDLELDDKLSVKNYHFTEYYLNTEIKFDYILRSGRCNTTNAKYLMKMVGIDLTE